MQVIFEPLHTDVPEYCALTAGRLYDVVKQTVQGYHVFDDGGLSRIIAQADARGSLAYAVPQPPSPVTGRKDDGGKLDLTLYDDMPRALGAVAEVMQWAITKKQPVPYIRGSWLGVAPDRYRAAIKRHDLAATKQASEVPPATAKELQLEARFQRDDETNLLHLAHMACSALFALELTMREMESNAE